MWRRQGTFSADRDKKMLLVTVNAYDPGTHQYCLVCDTRVAKQLDEIETLFESPGRYGMNYQYRVLDNDNGRSIAMFYSNRLDLVDSLCPNYRHVSV